MTRRHPQNPRGLRCWLPAHLALIVALGGLAGLGSAWGIGIAPSSARADGNGQVDAEASTTESSEFGDGERLFALKVLPVLRDKCFACHGGSEDRLEAGLDLTSRDELLFGSVESEEVLVPGDSSRSLLYEVVTWTHDQKRYRMPPKEADRLSEEQTWWIRDWIDAGAPWPEPDRIEAIVEAEDDGVRVSTSGGLSPDWTERRYKPQDLWAYQEFQDPPIPDTPSATHPIDAFLNRQLEAIDLEPAPRADRVTLIRRASFDLIGLPPTPEQIDAFVEDSAPDAIAFAKLVDRLLASPQYGEAWGLRWLDVVRYADTAGFANDYERPNAWRYRDYVVRSFNRDTPYDQFIAEQLAGDEIDPKDPEALIATGFLRMGPWEHTAMSVAKVTRQQFLDDVTDAVGQVFLAHPLQCARCHDHKFDPIPTRDYYRIQAVFATTQFAEPSAPFLDDENTESGFDEVRYLKERIKRYQEYKQQIDRKIVEAEKRWYAERGLDYAPRSEKLKAGVPEDQIAPRRIGLDPADFGLDRIARKTLTRHNWERDRYQPFALAVYSGKTPKARSYERRQARPEDPLAQGQLERTAILTGGDVFSPSEPVTPGVLSALPGSNDTVEPNHWNTIPEDVSGRRRGFADWIASPANTLSARVMVNRIWQGHFGVGLVETANNFGAMGDKPTHPELLDWLTSRFVDSGWSIKQLHRLIMTSQAYQRSAHHPDPKTHLERDPERTSYAAFRPRRLTAEEIRDAMLAASGELNPEPGGVPVRPDINLEAALQPRMIMGTYAPAYQPSPDPAQRHRRTIYAIRIRGLRDPFLEVFNQPGYDESCPGRETSTIAPQAFSLFNGRSTHDRALALADRLIRQAKTPAQAIVNAFRLVHGRPPEPEILQACLDHWQAMTERLEGLDPPSNSFPQQITREVVDENTGEVFQFTEILEGYRDYVPDLQAYQVDARTRALADLCLVLFNSNAFLYVE